jgi:hypothetical protein
MIEEDPESAKEYLQQNNLDRDQIDENELAMVEDVKSFSSL